jgi:hypothetical protein
LFFASIYYFLLLDYKKNFIIPSDFSKKLFLNNKALIALFISINLQSTVVYIDIKCKTIFVKTIFTLQIVITILIAFLYLTVN